VLARISSFKRQIVSSRDNKAVDKVVERVAQNAVPNVVAQASDLAANHFFVRNLQLGLAVLQVLGEFASQVADTQRVLEAVVRGGGKHRVHATELLHVAQALECYSVHDGSTHLVQLNGSVHIVFQQLGRFCVVLKCRLMLLLLFVHDVCVCLSASISFASISFVVVKQHANSSSFQQHKACLLIAA
jgi:hypothetical protein